MREARFDARSRRARIGIAGGLGAIAVGAALVVLVSAGGRIPGSGIAARSGAPSEAVPGGTTTPAVSPGATGSLAPTPTPSPTPEPTALLVPAPLTGIPVPPAAASRRVVAVMIDDQKDARPQSGFSSASVVWHAPAEGGIPRYMLLFQETVPGLVGPVRSARQYYIEWAAEWNALYVHVGGSPQALQTLQASGSGRLVYNADEFRWGGRYLWRAKDRVPPHNVYTDGERLRALAKRLGAADVAVEPAWTFGRALAKAARPDTGTVVVRYPCETVTYRYDPATNTYPRYIDNATKPQVDAADGSVVAPTNVVILRMRFGALNDGHPSKKRLEASDVGSGEAWISTNGRTNRARWKKDSIDGPTRLFRLDGTPFQLTPGQTFVQVIALTYGYEIHDGEPPLRPGGPTKAD